MCTIGIRVTGTDLDDRPERFVAVLEDVGRAGYEAVEILPDDFDLIIGGKLCGHTLDKLDEILGGYRFHISVHVPLRLNLFDRERDIHMEVLRCCLDICARLEAGVLVYHPGRYVDNVDFFRYGRPEAHHDPDRKLRLLDHERACLSTVAREYPGVTIAMENHRPYADYSPYSYAEFVGELVDMIREINLSNVRMCLDTGHLNLATAYYRADPGEWIREALPWIVHTHIHDNHGIVNFHTEKDKTGMLPFGRGDEHNLPGRGNFPFEAFFRTLCGYRGVHLFEPTSRYFNPAKIRLAFETISRLIENADVDGERVCGAV